MLPLCRHRAEKALEAYWQRPIHLKESTTLATALMNPQANCSHVFLMQNLGMHMEQARQIYLEHAPHDCHCDDQGTAAPVAA